MAAPGRVGRDRRSSGQTGERPAPRSPYIPALGPYSGSLVVISALRNGRRYGDQDRQERHVESGLDPEVYPEDSVMRFSAAWPRLGSELH